MTKSWEMAVTAAIVVLIVVPVTAGVYVGLTSTKADHHGPKPGMHAEAGHVAGIQPAAGHEEPAHGAVSTDSAEHHPVASPHPAPGVSGGHAEGGYAPPHLMGDGATQAVAPSPQEPVCGYQELVGQHADEAVFAKIRAAHKVYRVLKPGSVMTMDYSAERVNLNVDDHDVITSVTCG